MGLALEVGYLADMIANDEEGAQWFRKNLASLNRALTAAGLKAHAEPERVGDVFSCSMWGYGGLHYLRRIAAYDALERGLPDPGGEGAAEDSTIEDYNDVAIDRPQTRYAHLMLHSDAEGYYVPQDFADVIFTDDDAGIPGCMVGSVQQLHRDCLELAALLALPTDLDPESDEVAEAAEAQGKGSGWRRYGVESYSCLQLLRACEASLKSGALLVFC